MDADSPHSASCPIDAAVCPHAICHTQCNFVWHIVRALPTTAAHSSGAEQGVDCGVMQSRQRAFCPKPPGASAISIAIPNICKLLQFDETFVYWRLILSKKGSTVYPLKTVHKNQRFGANSLICRSRASSSLEDRLSVGLGWGEIWGW